MEKYFFEDKNKAGLKFFETTRNGACCCFEAHIHSLTEILFFSKGKFKVICDDMQYYAEEGDMLLIRSYTIHQIFALTEGYNAYYVLQISPWQILSMANSNTGTSYLLNFSIGNKNAKTLWKKEECKQNGIRSVLASLISEWENRQFAFDMALTSYASYIILKILRDTQTQIDDGKENEDLKRRIYDIVIYINRHYSEDITAQECSRIVSLSFSYFSRSFKSIIGQSFKDYLNLVRINHAEQALASTKKPITEIASNCGFNSTSHFIVTYKKLKNTTPLAYRKSLQKNQDL